MNEMNIKGFNHLDIKPDNIIIGYDKEMKFTDFGTARYKTNQTTKT